MSAKNPMNADLLVTPSKLTNDGQQQLRLPGLLAIAGHARGRRWSLLANSDAYRGLLATLSARPKGARVDQQREETFSLMGGGGDPLASGLAIHRHSLAPAEKGDTSRVGRRE
jgi:hypothetical protein